MYMCAAKFSPVSRPIKASHWLNIALLELACRRPKIIIHQNIKINILPRWITIFIIIVVKNLRCYVISRERIIKRYPVSGSSSRKCDINIPRTMPGSIPRDACLLLGKHILGIELRVQLIHHT